MHDENNSTQDELDWKQKYWDSLDRTSAEESRAYDKNVLTLSSAALGASLVLLKDISGDTPIASWLLAVSWVALGLTIAITLLSMRLAVLAHDKEMEELGVDESESGAKPVNKVSKWVDRANWSSYGFFLVGVAFLCMFAFVNMETHTYKTGDHMYRHGSAEQRPRDSAVLGDKEDIEEGRRPPSPPPKPPPKK